MRAALVRRPEIGTQLAALEQQLQTQIQERHRVERLLEARAANQKQLDDIQAQIALIERQIKAQHSSLSNTSEGISGDVAAMHFQMAQLDDYLRKCRLTNPMSGTVLVKYAEPGEMAVPGRPLYKLGDTGNMILRAYLTSAQVAQIKTGQKVEVYADYGEDGYRTFEGVVQWVSDKAEFTPKTIQTRDERANLVYAVKIGVQNDGYLKIGMYGEVKLNQL
jgi:HlyD family secretion protein